MRNIFIVILMTGTLVSAQTWNFYHTGNSGLPSNAVQAVCIEPSGIKWFGTDAGLVRFDGSEWQVFTKTEDQQTLADNFIEDIAFERTSYGPEIWVGTKNGLTILDVDGFSFATPYRTDDRPLLSNQVNAVAVDSNHVKWFATDKGVSIFNGHDWWALTEENEMLIQNEVFCIGIDNECDSLWRYFGTSQNSVSRIYYRDLDAISYASPYKDWTPMMSDSILAFHVVRTHKHWIGTGLGLYEHDSTETKENWKMYTTYEGLVHNWVLSLAEGLDGSMWIGTMGGVSHYTDGMFINYTQTDGLAGNQVNDIAVDLDGSLWFATNGGVSHLTDFTEVHAQNMLPVSSQLITNTPNPFNPSTVIHYQLTHGGVTRLVVYDVQGREIIQLVNGIQASGLNQVIWHGRDQLGRPVPAGIYIARLHILGTQRIASMKMILIK